MKTAFNTIILFAISMAVIAGIAEAQNVEIKRSLPGRETPAAEIDSQKVEMLIEYGRESLVKGEMDTARVYFDRVMYLADSLNFDYARQLSLYGLGDLYLVQQKFDSAETVLTEAAGLNPGITLQSKIKNLLATSYRFQGDNQRAIDLYKEVLAATDTTAEARTAAGIAQNLGDAYMNLGATAEAFQNYDKAISFGEKAKDSLLLATSLNNIGESHNRINEYDKAAYYLERGLEISKAIDFKPGQLRVLLNLGNTRSSQSRFQEAEKLYAEALELSKKVRPDTPPVQIQYNLGELYYRMGRHDDAETYFQMSLDNSMKSGIPQGIYYNSTGLGNVEIARNNIVNAISRYITALETARKLNNPPFIQAAHEKLYELNKKQGDYEAALNHLEAFRSISDSLKTEESDRMLADYKTRLEVQRKDQLNTALEAEKTAQQAQLQLQYWFLGLGALVIAVVGIFAALLFKANREKNKINRQLKDQKKRLEEANDVKDKLFSIVAHDLRTPLSAMTGILELVREQALSEEEMRELFREMEFSLQQNMNVMENLLVWAKQQMSGLNVEIRPLKAKEVVDEILEAYKFNARHKQISLKNKLESNLEVLGDYDLFKLVIRNLISNSIKFSEPGNEIVIDAKIKDEAVLFEVRDRGVGIPEEIQTKIFSDGMHSRKGTRQEKGSGLGLTLCKESVEKQGGGIYFESTEGKGTTFYFTLPAFQEEERIPDTVN